MAKDSGRTNDNWPTSLRGGAAYGRRSSDAEGTYDVAHKTTLRRPGVYTPTRTTSTRASRPTHGHQRATSMCRRIRTRLVAAADSRRPPSAATFCGEKVCVSTSHVRTAGAHGACVLSWATPRVARSRWRSRQDDVRGFRQELTRACETEGCLSAGRPAGCAAGARRDLTCRSWPASSSMTRTRSRSRVEAFQAPPGYVGDGYLHDGTRQGKMRVRFTPTLKAGTTRCGCCSPPASNRSRSTLFLLSSKFGEKGVRVDQRGKGNVRWARSRFRRQQRDGWRWRNRRQRRATRSRTRWQVFVPAEVMGEEDSP